MSKDKEIAEDNDDKKLNSDAVQDNPELIESEDKSETSESTDSADAPEDVKSEESDTSQSEINGSESSEPKEEEHADAAVPQDTIQEESSTKSEEAEQSITKESPTPSEQPSGESESTTDDSSDESEVNSSVNSENENKPEESDNNTDKSSVEDKSDNTSSKQEQPTSKVEDEQETTEHHSADEHHDDEHHDDDDHEEEIDYASLSKEELLKVISDISGNFSIKKASKALNEIKAVYDELYQAEKEKALESFVAGGGEKDDFDYKGDEADVKIEEYFKIIREKRGSYYHDLEKQKDHNLTLKNELLEKLRDLVHEEENTASINALKEIQNEWRSIGPVHPQHNKTLWANYHALVNQFYDQRSIYFELKELDRRKNLESKLEICKKAEELGSLENFNEAVKKLNELHDEYKHIGPVPRDQQEALWTRFKTASDNIYAKRKEFVTSLKETLHQNLEKKVALADKVLEYSEFKSDKISEWNKQTKEILALQKEWESIGSMPKESAKEVNRKFWGAFKGFFHHKSEFFKSLESKREENLQLKQELVDKANELKESEDWMATANKLKELQRDWKDIGPVPEKDREPIYKAFKSACDEFFNRKREHNKEVESSYDGNLKEKENICAELEKLAKTKEINPDDVYALQDKYSAIGFVPKRAIKAIQRRYREAIDAVINNADNLDDAARSEMASLVRLHGIKSGPHADQKIHRQEHALKRKISHLENDIATWKNNMGFFANSKNADELMKDFNKKIEKAEQELKSLKDELKIISGL